MKNKFFITLGVLFLVLVIAELSLRYCFGFCDALLYESNNRYEYIAQPNQKRFRFGARICYNAYSQRSDAPDSTKIKVLGLGDSVLFGGTWMDQDSLATTLVTNETGIQMLNISCGSWGPDNCAAYLSEKGFFDAKAIVLVCSSHDAYDVMSNTPVVDVYPNYPSSQYILALIEITDRYICPRIRSFFCNCFFSLDPDEEVVNATRSVRKKCDNFNPGFDKLKSMVDSLQIPMAIYLHAELGEIRTGRYNDMGRDIINWAQSNDVPIMKGIEYGEKEYMYYDVIHFNEKGQRHLANSLKLLFDLK